MRSFLLATFLALTLAAPALAYQAEVEGGPYFSPLGGATKAVVNVLASARKSIYVQAYSLTSEPIAEGLVDRRAERGVAAGQDRAEVGPGVTIGRP